jgi:hypothetical protein
MRATPALRATASAVKREAADLDPRTSRAAFTMRSLVCSLAARRCD